MSELSITQKIYNRYDPEKDLIPGGPMVTWAELDLAYAVRLLLARIEKLEGTVKIMKSAACPFCGVSADEIIAINIAIAAETPPTDEMEFGRNHSFGSSEEI